MLKLLVESLRLVLLGRVSWYEVGGVSGGKEERREVEERMRRREEKRNGGKSRDVSGEDKAAV